MAKLLIVILWLCCGARVCAQGGPTVLFDSSLVLEDVVPTGILYQPTTMAFLGDNEFLVGEFCGRVWHFRNNVGSHIFTFPANCSGEAGFLYFLPDPDFPNTNHIYISYVGNATLNYEYRVSRFTWTGTALTNETVIARLTSAAQHVGGAMAFGPPNAAPQDQKLFIVTGDLLNTNQQTVNNAAGTSHAAAAMILRMNRDGSSPAGDDKGPFYDVAGGNPYIEKMYAYGIRNSFGLAFDPLTNYLWDTENATDYYDEINLVQPGMNSGWNVISGSSTRLQAFQSGRRLSDLVQFGDPPVGTYSDPELSSSRGLRAPTAIVFFTTDTLGAKYYNNCLVAGFGNPNPGLYHFPMNADRDGFELTGDLADKVIEGLDDISAIRVAQISGITDMRIGPDGYLYIVSLLNNKVARLRLAEAAVDEWALY